MNLLHISDMHFGPRHWTGNQEMLLDKLNSYPADIVLNTGDSTTDSLESEFEDAGNFLKALKSPHVISVVGNHDKRNMRSQDFFRTYIDKVDLIRPKSPEVCEKNKIFLDKFTTGIKENFTDCNFVKSIIVKGKKIAVVGLDTTEIFQDNGFVDEEILTAVSREIEKTTFDNILLLYHHSIFDTDSDPLFNSERVIKLIRKHGIQHTFCGHTHRLALVRSTDIINKHSFTQYKNGSLSSCNIPEDSNMFLYFEDFASENMKIHLNRVFIEQNKLRFEEEIITA
ncbi:MAG: metallophosphoesterase [Pseudomonadales bacterium]|nr:metallophosphoesterase [Pseudomonadales bacterium]